MSARRLSKKKKYLLRNTHTHAHTHTHTNGVQLAFAVPPPFGVDRPACRRRCYPRSRFVCGEPRLRPRPPCSRSEQGWSGPSRS